MLCKAYTKNFHNMIFETKFFIKWFFLQTKLMLWKFFWNHQKRHAIEDHAMEIHVRRGLAVILAVMGLYFLRFLLTCSVNMGNYGTTHTIIHNLIIFTAKFGTNVEFQSQIN